MMRNNMSGVILAGGANKRFGGRTKSNIAICGQSIISRIIDTISEIFKEIIIVTNSPEEFTDFSRYKITRDEFLKVGPLGGIHAAMKAASKEALFVFAGDMPLIERNLIEKQIECYEKCKYDILTPRIGRYVEPLHSIYDISLLKTLEKYLSGNHDNAVWKFFRNVDVGYFEIEATEELKSVFMNVNSPSDISMVEKILRDRN